jgi:hypothetical protein
LKYGEKDMEINEALDILECMANLNDSELLSYMRKHNRRIGKAARIGAEAIRGKQRLNKLLECWEVSDATKTD